MTTPWAQPYLDTLAGRDGVIGVWIAHGEACQLEHDICTTYFLAIDKAHAVDILSEMRCVYFTHKTIREAPMCWTTISLIDGVGVSIELLAVMAGSKSDPTRWERIR